MTRAGPKVFFDGGCRPNPGAMEAAVVVRGVVHVFDGLGTGTSTEAEWRALACAVRLARALGLEGAVFLGDSREVVAAAARMLATGAAPCGPAAELAALLADYRPAGIRWIRRGQNLAGIALDARRLR